MSLEAIIIIVTLIIAVDQIINLLEHLIITIITHQGLVQPTLLLLQVLPVQAELLQAVEALLQVLPRAVQEDNHT